MDRNAFLDELAAYRPFDAVEREMHTRLQQFVAATPNCFERTCPSGHITSSCWIVDPQRRLVLLTHHRRLNRWLQMGGHVEQDATLLASALREALEESGLQGLRVLSPAIFDLDVHLIPARGEEPAHYHYDVRYLFEADPAVPLQVSEESHEIAWVPLDRIAEFNADASVMRLAAKSPHPQ